jgi:hypothetical protein
MDLRSLVHLAHGSQAQRDRLTLIIAVQAAKISEDRDKKGYPSSEQALMLSDTQNAAEEDNLTTVLHSYMGD